MKNFFRLAILSILSISLLSSCAKFKKSCSTECANSKKEEAKVEEQVKLMLEQLKDRNDAEIKQIFIEVCRGEESKLASHFKEKGGD